MANMNRMNGRSRNSDISRTAWSQNEDGAAEYLDQLQRSVTLASEVVVADNDTESSSEDEWQYAVGAVGATGAVGGGAEEVAVDNQEASVEYLNEQDAAVSEEVENNAQETVVPSESVVVENPVTEEIAGDVQAVEVVDDTVNSVDVVQEVETIVTEQTSVADTSVNASADTAQALQAGITLDIARHYYSVDIIKQYIDTIGNNGGGFLQLHISDNENYGFESDVLGQTVDQARLNADGSYTNEQTGQQFLSYDQIREIVDYAQNAGVEIIPDVDSPSHIGGMLELLNYSKGAEFVADITSSVASDEIDITSQTAIQFMQSLYKEVIGLTGEASQHFHIGGDEFGYSADNNFEFIQYVNTMADYLDDYGLTTRIWNDGLIKSNLSDLNHNVEVTYWSYDGNPGNEAVSAEREALRADMQDLLDNGFDVLNYNSYYLYYVPNDGSNAESAAYMAKEIQATWDVNVWDQQDTTNIADDTYSTGKIIGASLAVWGEHADGVSSSDIYEWSDNSFVALAAKLNMKTSDFSLLEEVSFDLNNDTPVNEVWDVTDSVGELLTINASDEFLAHGNAFLWVNGEFGDILSFESGWAASGASALEGDTSYTLYKNGNNHVYVDTDIAVSIV